MTENKPLYEVEENDENGFIMAGLKPVVQFEKPSQQIAEYKGEYKIVRSLGWVKFSTEFRNAMLAQLKGAKLAVFVSIVLHLNENGNSFPSAETMARETGYNRETVLLAVAEMEKIPGLLQVLRSSGRKNIYHPAFAARGKREPVGISAYPDDQSDLPEQPVEETPTGLCETSRGFLDYKKKEEIKQTGDDTKIFNELESLMGSLNSSVPSLVDKWLEKHELDRILQAIGVAKEKGARSVKYIDEILITWEANGYPKTREERVAQRKGNGNSPDEPIEPNRPRIKT